MDKQDQCLRVRGDLTLAEVPKWWACRDQWLSLPLACLELSELSRVDSAGLALLLEVEQVARQDGVPLRWQHCPDQLESLMQLYNLNLVDGQLGHHQGVSGGITRD